MSKTLAVFFALVATALAQENDTAYHAMRTVGNQLGRGALHRIVEVSGVRGNPQPARWRVLLADRNFATGIREIEVANGRIVSDHASESGGGNASTIQTAKLNLDSSGAYAVAAHTADTSHVIFNSVSYTLRNDHRGNPVWIVALEGGSGEALGTIHIGANRGNIARVEGMYRGRNLENGDAEAPVVGREGEHEAEPEVTDADEADENIVKRRIKEMFRRTSRDAAAMFHRVRRSFADYIDPDR
jgi:hypothetical protein